MATKGAEKNIRFYYITSSNILEFPSVINRGYLFFSVKDRNLFHRVETIGNIFTSGAAMSESITDGVHEMK